MDEGECGPGCLERVWPNGVKWCAEVRSLYGVPAGNRTQIGRLGGNSFIQLNYGDARLAS